MIHCAMGSPDWYVKRSRHLDSVPSELVTLGQLAFAPVGEISEATRRYVPRLQFEMATDCPLAALQFEQALGVRPIHPIQVLARAYRADGFPHKIEPPEKKEPDAAR